MYTSFSGETDKICCIGHIFKFQNLFFLLSGSFVFFYYELDLQLYCLCFVLK